MAGLLFLLWLRFHQPPNTVDDAYITFRYARNLVSGAGLVYNAGERVLGTTTPAYALLLAALSGPSGLYDYPRLALMINAACDALTFALLVRLAGRLTGYRWVGLGAALLFAIDGRVLDWSTGGMEASFNVLAIVLTLVLFSEDRREWAALTAGLAVLIRPDGATLAAAIFLGWGLPALRQPRRWPWRELAVFVGVVAPWYIFATLFYGAPIPQSVLAKSIVYRLPPLVGFRAFLVQLRTVFPFSLPPLREGQTLVHQIAQASLPAGLCLLGAFALLKRYPRAWVVALYIVLFITFFSVGNPLWLGWYETPMMPLYQLLILAAALWMAERIAYRLSPGSAGPAVRGVVALGAVALMAIPQLSRLNLIPWETPQHAPFVLNATFNKRREADYQLFAEMLSPAARAQRLVAIPEIGAFGYSYPGSLFDTTGLISPAIARYFPIPPEIPIEIYSVPRQMIFDLRPDLFVTFDSFIQATLDPADPEFLRLYRPTLGLTSHAAFGIQRLIAYRRNDLPMEVTLPAEAVPVEAHFGPDYLRLTGYQVVFTADADHQFVDAILFWQGRDAPIERDLLVRVRLIGADGSMAYEILDQPGEKLFPTPGWTPGMWLVDRYPLKRPAPDIGPYTVAVTVFASDADEALPARAADGAALLQNTFTIPGVTIPANAAAMP
jgi:hypothetical protein